MNNSMFKIMTRRAGAWRQSAGLLLIPLFMAAQSYAISQMDIGGGSLYVGASLTVGELNVSAGATLGGSGTIIGNVTVEGTLDPALSTSSPAAMTIVGDADFLIGSTFRCHAATHTSCDQLVIDGLVGGSCNVEPSRTAGAVPVNKDIIVANNDSYYFFTLSPADQQNWRIRIGDSNDLLLTHTTGDTDIDGLPDWFELEHFSDRTAGDPDGHEDNDGMTNFDELIAGTDPTDGASSFAVNLLHLGDGTFLIEWASVAEREYIIYYGYTVESRINQLGPIFPATPPTNSIGPMDWDAFDSIFIHGTVRRAE